MDATDETAPRGADALATIAQRIAARLLDWFLLLAVWLVTAWLTSSTDADGVNSVPLWARLGWGLLVVAYEAGFVSANGQTPGKRLMRIRIVSMRVGSGVSLLQSIARVVPVFVAMGVLGQWFPVAMVFVYFSAAFMEDRRGLLDRLANTAVILAGP